MSADDLIAQLAAQGMELWLEAGKLRYRAPANVATPEMLAALKRHRDEIVMALAAPAGTPLSIGQQALWFLHRRAPESAAYNVAVALRIFSAVDGEALSRSFTMLWARHPCLRASFPEVDGRPLQLIRPATDCVVARIDAAGLDDAALRRRVMADYRAPFDLAQGPVFRVTLFSRAGDDHVLLVCVHHIVADAASLGILLEELALIYPAERARAPTALPPPSLPYAEYVRRETALLDGSEGAPLKAYWQDRLAGEIAVLDLPIDHPRPPVQAMRGAVHGFRLDAALSAALRERARAEGVTLFMLLAASFQLLLHRYSGQGDVVIGTPTMLRAPDFARTVGYFVNPLPLRSVIDGDPDFRRFLAGLRGQVVGALAHGAYPFPRIVDDLTADRDASRSPIFQAMFVFQQFPRDSVLGALLLADDESLRVDWGGLTLAPFDLPQQAGQFDLVLEIVDGGAALGAALKFDTDLFDPATVERLAENLMTLLRGIVAAPNLALSRLPILAEAERRQLVESWNATREDLRPPLCLHQGFEAQVRRTPDTIAVEYEDRSLTYRELDARANRLARFLRGLGIGPDRPVAVLAERSLEMIIGIYGVLKAGGAYLPLDPSLPEARIAFMIADVGASVVLTHGALLPPPGTARIVHLDADWPAIAREEPLPPISEVGGDHLAYVIYTSGSTGRPKGVMVSHRAIVNYLAWREQALPMTAADRVLQKTPFGFDVSLFELFQPLLAGARLVMARPGGHQDPGYLIDTIARHGITIIHFVPPMLRAFLDHPAIERARGLRRVFCSGEALPLELQRRFLETLPAVLHNLYGPTEAAVDVSLWRCGSDAAYSFVPIGRPIANVRFHVLDRHMALQPIGVAGELYIGGICLARGYHARPDLTAAAFVPDPFALEPGARLYRTGDLVRLLPDGTVQFLGRLDHQVKIRGNRIELGEIEAMLLRHTAIREAVVVARRDRGGAPRLVAYVTLAAGAALVEEALQRSLREFVPDYMVPNVFVALDHLPLGPSGKVDRKALPVPQVETGGDEFAPPRQQAEIDLCRIWAELTGRDRVGIHDNFFRLGGDSILSIQMVARAARLGLHLRVSDLFQHQTVAELAAIARFVATPNDDQGAITGPVPLAPIQRWFVEQALDQAQHFNQALLFQPCSELDADRLEAALAALVKHHDALRLRFHGDGDTRIQTNAPPDDAPVLDVVDLTAEEGGLAAIVAARQASLDLARGPLFRATLIRHGASTRLLLVAHHLVIDGVSWRILIEDLEMLLRRGDAPPGLPAKTTSYRFWSERLQDYAHSAVVTAERDYWLAQLAVPPATVPIDGDGRAPTVRDAVCVTDSVDAARTAALLHDAHVAFNTGVEDFLLAALALTVARHSDSESFRIDLEAHGRQPPVDDIDLTRTVGWFTSLFPLVLRARRGDDKLVALTAAKEARRSVPNGGLGFGLLRFTAGDDAVREAACSAPAQILFNYLGRIEFGTAEGAILRLAADDPGPLRAPAQRRPHALEIDALIMDGQLQITWRFSPGLHRRATIETLAGDFHSNLVALIEQCGRSEIGGYTPSDFPLVRIDRRALAGLPPRVIEDMLPLTPMQQGMLFHTLYASDRAIYHQQLRLTLAGALDAPAFARRWSDAVGRHALLRAGVLRDGLSEPLLAVYRRLDPAWQDFDWRSLSVADQAKRLEAFCADDAARGFDLAAPPLLRFALFRLADQRHVFVLSFHHLVMDGWSLARLLGEVLAQQRSPEEAGACHAVPVRQWRDYVRWLAERRGAIDQAREFWRREFAGCTASAGLGIDRGPPAGAIDFIAQERYLSEAATASLQALAQREGVTLSIVTQAAWALVMARYSGSDDVVFGATVAGRPAELPDVDAMVGLFINTLPVRVGLPRETAIGAWLRSLLVAQHARETYGWCALTDIQGWAGPASLFDTLLVFENYPVDASLKTDAAGLTIADGRIDERSNYPLTLIIVPGPRLRVRASFAQGRFESDAIDRVLAHFMRVLESLAAAPDGLVGSVDLMSADERALVVRAFGGRSGRAVSVTSLWSAFLRQVERRGTAAALRCGEVSVGYSDLAGRACGVAGALRDRGIGVDDAVGIMAERSVGLIAGLIGIAAAGGGYVGLDAGDPPARLRQMAAASGLKAVVAEARHAGVAAMLGVPVVILEEAAPDADWRDVAVRGGGESLAYVSFTSGSTGTAKGVAVSQRSVLSLVLGSDYARLDESETVLHYAPVGFDASTFEIWGALLTGGCLVVMPPGVASLAELGETIRREEVTTLWLTAGLFELMVAERLSDLRGVRQLLAGGDVLPVGAVRRVLAALPECRLINGYGPTETTTFACCHAVSAAEAALGPIPIGRPIAGAVVYILDRQMRPCAIGVSGEIYIGGNGVARGYAGEAAMTAAAFVPDPFSTRGERLYRSGDLGRWRPDGVVEFLGRADDQVKLRGYRLSLGAIETALGDHAGVERCVVVARGEGAGKRLIAYVVAPGVSVTELRAHLAERLPRHAVPSQIVTLAALPITANGKIDRAALPAPPQSGAMAAQSESERRIAAIWQEVLGIDQLGRDDNFFDLGGHSLSMALVHARLPAALGCEIALVDLFRYPTVRSLAAILAQADGPTRETSIDAGRAEERLKHRDLAARQRRLRRAPPSAVD